MYQSKLKTLNITLYETYIIFLHEWIFEKKKINGLERNILFKKKISNENMKLKNKIHRDASYKKKIYWKTTNIKYSKF